MILPVPHLHQPERGGCLAACAAMVLTYMRIRANYHQLLKLLQVQKPYGTPFPKIRRLEQLKVTVLFGQSNLANLPTFLSNDQPIIVPVQTSELPYWTEHTDHAVVVVGIDPQFIYLNDPAFSNAPIQVPLGDFDLAWLARDEYYAVLSP
jgi:ABC-type bacteriocin/lantibiotic exporter with double-glycine peptidase domain